jgi:hypothetical protein
LWCGNESTVVLQEAKRFASLQDLVGVVVVVVEVRELVTHCDVLRGTYSTHDTNEGTAYR